MRVPGPRVTPEPDVVEPGRSMSIRAIADGMASMDGALLPILHEVVSRHGFVDDTDVPVIAEVLNLSRADVIGVLSFYHDFRRTPPPAHTVRICRGEACQAVGSAELYAAAQGTFAEDEQVEVAEVFCLGNCALGPSGLIDDTLVGRLDLIRVRTSVAATDEGTP